MRALLLSALLVAAAPAALAQTPAEPAAPVATVAANINITPKRLTFDRAKRNATIFVVNQGDADVTIDIALVDRIMNVDGQIVAAEDASKRPELAATLGQLKTAKDMLQLSPRRVTLAAGKGQTIRVRLADLPAESAAPEYRTHLTVTTVPPRDTGTTAETAAAPAGSRQLSFKVNAVYGVSIPVIVRTAPAQAQARLENLRIETVDMPGDGRTPAHKMQVLALDVVRAGPNSLYGAFEVRSQAQKRGDPPIGAARGVGVYTEIDHRTVRIPLTRAPAAGEKLEVTFTDDDTSPGKVLAKSTL